MDRSTDCPSADPLLAAGSEALTDACLVERVRQGDKGAYRVLVERYEPKVLRIARRFLHDRQWAEDAGQEAFLRAYLQLGDFDVSKRFGPWLFGIVVNLCVDLLRRARRRRLAPLENTDDLADHQPPVGAAIERQELQRQVRRVVDRLPLKYRIVLVLRDLEGFSCSEVAAIVRRPEATVRWRLSRARQMFRRSWELAQVQPPRRSR